MICRASVAVNPDELYTQPDKSKKKQKDKARDKGEGKNNTVGADQLYAQPDKSKKKGAMKKQGKQQQPIQSVTDPEQLYTQPSKGHAAGMLAAREGTKEAAPQLHPPYIQDEEHYYNTRSGPGPPNQERNYEYAILDWQQNWTMSVRATENSAKCMLCVQVKW